MKHARRDYQNLKALDLKIPDNEPVFLLRGQDVTAADTVRFWASLQKDSYLKEIALRHAVLMDNWPNKKFADCPDSEIPEEFQDVLFHERQDEEIDPDELEELEVRDMFANSDDDILPTDENGEIIVPSYDELEGEDKLPTDNEINTNQDTEF